MAVTPTNGYCTGTQLKAALGGIADTNDDASLELAINAASRLIDRWCQRRFWQDASDTTRYYTASNRRRLTLTGQPESVDLTSATTVTVDMSGNGTYGRTVTEGTDFVLAPRSQAADSRPYQQLQALPGWEWPAGFERVKIVGTFGWAAVPDEVEQACIIQASRIFKTAREAPYGIAGLTVDGGGMRLLARVTPDVELLLAPYRLVTVL